jgi:hypothetical protein
MRLILAVSLILLPAYCQAATISAGANYFLPGQIGKVPVDCSGGDLVANTDVYVQIETGGDDPPVIIAIDVVSPGLLFGADNIGQFDDTLNGRTWMVSTCTDNGAVPALGTLAWITIDTTGTSAGQSFALRLKDIEPGIFGEPGASSQLGLEPSTVIDGTINIIDLHTMTWEGGDGAFETDHWTGGPMLYPDRTTDAVINDGTVTAGVVEVNSLTITGSSSLTAASITADTLTIGPGTGMAHGSANAVPEPSAIALICSALGILGFSGARKK